MSTAKEIEAIIGISARTIETWSRGRNDKYLLAKLLKSYSKFELSQRIDHILKEDGLRKKSLEDIIISIAENPYKAGIIDSDESFYIRGSSHLNLFQISALPDYKPFQSNELDDISGRVPALTIEMVEDSLTEEGKPLKKILIVDFASLLPSKNNLIAMYDKYNNNIIEIFSKDDIDGDKYLYSVQLILITKSKKPKFLREEDEFTKKIKIFDFDEITKKLYGKAIIAI